MKQLTDKRKGVRRYSVDVIGRLLQDNTRLLTEDERADMMKQLNNPRDNKPPIMLTAESVLGRIKDFSGCPLSVDDMGGYLDAAVEDLENELDSTH